MISPATSLICRSQLPRAFAYSHAPASKPAPHCTPQPPTATMPHKTARPRRSPAAARPPAARTTASPRTAEAAPAADAPYDFSAQIGHLLRRAHQRHAAVFQAFIPDSTLTVAQFVVMCALRDHGSCSISELVKTTVIDQATIRGVVERLKNRQLIALEPDPIDRRKVSASLSPQGQTLVAEVEPFARTITEETFGTLNSAERVALLYLLQKMIDSGYGNTLPDSDQA